MGKVNSYNELKWKPRVDRFKKCKTRGEWDVVTRRTWRALKGMIGIKDLMKLIVKERESRGQPLLKELEDLLQHIVKVGPKHHSSSS